MSCINQKKKDEEPEQKSTSNEEFLRSIRGSWERHYSESAFLKDVPRLVKRIRVHTRSGACHGPMAEDAPKIEAIVQLLELLSKELSSEEEVVRELRQKLESGLLGEELSEEHSVAHIFESLNPNGPIIKVLKLVNQGTVLYAMSVLKEDIFRDIMTKDVRTPQGWQIILRLGDIVQLEHVRTEQSLDAFGDQTNHFEVQWAVTVTFDNDLEQLTACSLRLVRFFPSPTMEPECLHNLRSSLIEGLIVL